jgi:adenosylmethionine-8-amino-7-oxononanoate aminotransferase
MVIIGMSGGADLQGETGDHVILAPAYNVTEKELEKIVDILVQATEEILG